MRRSEFPNVPQAFAMISAAMSRHRRPAAEPHRARSGLCQPKSISNGCDVGNLPTSFGLQHATWQQATQTPKAGDRLPSSAAVTQ